MDNVITGLMVLGGMLLVFVWAAFQSGAFTPDLLDALGPEKPKQTVPANLAYAIVGLALTLPILYFVA